MSTVNNSNEYSKNKLSEKLGNELVEQKIVENKILPQIEYDDSYLDGSYGSFFFYLFT